MHQSQTFRPKPNMSAAVRFAPVVNLMTGETVTLIAETEKRFEERAVFGRAALSAERSQPASPAAWLAAHIELVANEAHESETHRPVIVPAPLSALMDPNTSIACDAAIRRTQLCAQEICIEIADAALALPTREAQTAVESLRRCGFRVSLNATRSWEASLSTAMRLLLDSIRIDARHIDMEAGVDARIDTATSCGMVVIAENANWRDGDYLASLGVELGLRPRLDG